MKNLNQNWNLIYTRPSQENKVADQLSERGITFFLPKVRTVRQWHDRKKVVNTSLFPSYIFIQLNDKYDYYKCTKLDGFCYFVKFGDQLAHVSQKIIDDIDLIVNKGKSVEVSSNPIKPKQQMIITQGSLRGLSCEVVKCNGKQKICVHVNLFNRSILADMPPSLLEVNEANSLSMSS